jgi:hypothetical protein
LVARRSCPSPKVHFRFHIPYSFQF